MSLSIGDIYQLAIKEGVACDPRGSDGVKKALARLKREYDELPKKRKRFFDKEMLSNPYSDTRVLFGDQTTIVDKVLAGIDIGPGELVLADRLNERGEGIDLVIGHHPHGVALGGLNEVMGLQVEMMANYGVPITVAESLLRERISEVARSLNPVNHNRSVDAARLLGLPFMCIHTPADNHVYKFLTDLMTAKKPETVGEVMDLLMEIPEYLEAAKGKAGPKIFAGEKKNRCGRVVASEITGGTEGAERMYEKLANAGVGTIISMHQSEKHLKQAKKSFLNVIIAGHMSSDSLGLNLFLDKIESRGVEILPCSGFIRVSRN